MFQPSKHEKTFKVKPIGVKYICEFCEKGEMKVQHDQLTLISNPPLIAHVCTECGKLMSLPKMYPYIEWISDEEDENHE